MNSEPNVLLVIVDEWRAQSFGYAGDTNAHTPSVDRLAAESMNYTEAIAGTPVCCPSRASFLTGEYPLQHGVYVNDVPLKPQGPTLAETFRAAGYDTGYIGKWHLYGSPGGWLERRSSFVPPDSRLGFDYWRAGECTHDYWNSIYYAGDDRQPRVWPGYDAFAQTDDAVAYLRDRQRADRPFFLTLSFGPPHFPLDTAPAHDRELYADREIDVPINVPTDMREVAQEHLRGYYAHMAAIDDCVGQLLGAVDDLGLRDNTIVVFTSDHGDMMWSHGLEYKLVPWEESVRVPLLVRVPGKEAGTSAALFNSPDLMPTLLGYAGLPVPDHVQGRDLTHVENHPASAFLSVPASYSTLRWYGIGEYRGVRDHRFTYVRSLHGPWLLYDNVADPLQLHNLVDSPQLAEEQTRLENELDGWLQRLGDSFLPGEEYLRRDGLTHYFEVNEPIGYSGSAEEGWTSTIKRGLFFSADSAVSVLAQSPAARAVLTEYAPDLLNDPTLSNGGHDSPRVAAMLHVGLLEEDILEALDSALMHIGRRDVNRRDRTGADRAMMAARTPAEWVASAKRTFRAPDGT